MGRSGRVISAVPSGSQHGMINTAYSLGKENYPWWPDWKDECVAILASGGSAKKVGIEKLRDRIHVVTIKQTVELCKDWAEAVYGCDDPWWVAREGLPEFKGLKFSYGPVATTRFKNIHRVTIASGDDLMIEQPLVVGNGGNSGFQMLNLVAQFGVKGIILVGFDMNNVGGIHWYGRNTFNGMNNPAESNYQRWIQGFEAIKKKVKALDIDVVNVSPTSSLNAFRKSTIEDALKDWGL